MEEQVVLSEPKTDEVCLERTGIEYVVTFHDLPVQEKIKCPSCGNQADKINITILSIEPQPDQTTKAEVVTEVERNWGHECRFCEATDLGEPEFDDLSILDEEPEELDEDDLSDEGFP